MGWNTTLRRGSGVHKQKAGRGDRRGNLRILMWWVVSDRPESSTTISLPKSTGMSVSSSMTSFTHFGELLLGLGSYPTSGPRTWTAGAGGLVLAPSFANITPACGPPH